MSTTAVVLSGERRAAQFTVYALGWLRALQLTQGVLVTSLLSDHYRPLWPVVLLLVVEIVWCWWLFRSAFRRLHISHAQVAGDVALAAISLVVVGMLTRSGEAETWTNWSFPVGMGSSMLAAAVLPGLTWLPVVALLVVADVVGAVLLASGAPSVSNAIGNASSFVALAALSALVVRYVQSTGVALDDATEKARAAEVERAVEQARYQDRVTQYRTLHDTVLNTLTAIARGGLDYRTVEVRRRCAREADYLRRLLVGEVTTEARPLQEALSRVVEEAAVFGLRVHYFTDELPGDLPPDVVRALADATREGLTNVRRHAASDKAWVTATGEGDGVVIRIVDRGRGFDPSKSDGHLGVTDSIEGRMRDIGGHGTVSSAPREGTLVELTWSAVDRASD